MKNYILFFSIFCIAGSSHAQSSPDKKTEVLLLGFFHFASSGLDVAKFEDVNILSEKRQNEIKELVTKLKQFKPDKIFIEVPVSLQKRYDSLFTAYVNGTHVLEISETQQVGFRLAKECGLGGVHCVDYRASSFPMDSVVKVMVANKQADMLQYLQNGIQTEQANFNEQLKTKTITQLLIGGNNQKMYDKLVGIYYFFLKAGDKNNHAGSFLASEQWRRNMHIYENILKSMSGNEQKVLVMFGTTHVAMLKEMMKYNEDLKLVPVNKVL
ncbi:MAG TPA: DUF5694 domain-containing protein [Chitinophagaceae bacterium]|nr:DUF5694 domain-containing protein [Chitinophagaceae bacterium]